VNRPQDLTGLVGHWGVSLASSCGVFTDHTVRVALLSE